MVVSNTPSYIRMYIWRMCIHILVYIGTDEQLYKSDGYTHRKTLCMVGWRCGRDRFIGLVGALLSESTWYYWLIHCHLNQHSITIWLEPQKLMCETQRINARKEAPHYLIDYVPTADPCMATTLLLHTPPSNAVLLLSYQAQILHPAIAGSPFWWYTSVTCHGWTSGQESWGGPPFLSPVSPTQSGARRGSQRCSTPTHWELWPAPAVNASF